MGLRSSRTPACQGADHIRVSIEVGGPRAAAVFREGFEAAGYEVTISSPLAQQGGTTSTDFWKVLRIMIDDVHDTPRTAVLAYDLLQSGKATGVEEVIVLGPAAEELKRVTVKGHHWRDEAET